MSNDFNDVYNKSMSGEPVRIQKKRKKTKAEIYTRRVVSLLTLAGIITVSFFGTGMVKDKVSRDRKLSQANDYMRTKIVTYLDKSNLEYSVLQDKIIFENDQKKLNKFVELLKADGFSRDEIFYMVSQLGDKNEFDNIVKTSGWEDSDDFLREKYFTGEVSSSGETYLSKYGDMRKFENNVELDYVESVNDLIEMEESKGLNR